MLNCDPLHVNADEAMGQKPFKRLDPTLLWLIGEVIKEARTLSKERKEKMVDEVSDTLRAWGDGIVSVD